jgi:hypothetical protein
MVNRVILFVRVIRFIRTIRFNRVLRVIRFVKVIRSFVINMGLSRNFRVIRLILICPMKQ